MNVILTYGPQIQKSYMRLIITKQWKLFTVCTEQLRSPYIEHTGERATQPYLLGGGGMIYPGSRPAGVTACSPRMVIECLLIRSMLIKMYKFTISWYVPVYVHYIYSQSISCRHSLSVFSLSNCINVFVWQQFYQKAWIWVITTITIRLVSPFSCSCPPLTFWRSTH